MTTLYQRKDIMLSLLIVVCLILIASDAFKRKQARKHHTNNF